ncbi:MAG TPA: NAD-dependent epimerase/dehydratase family protein [Nitrospira sp.]|nr:NAD-dependent epimerase/dehydratase family protein [Nitrospira sp.]
MNSVLVTGAAGFLGSALLEDLRSCGYRVRALVRAESALWGEMREDAVVGDVRDVSCVRSAVAGCDSIVHLAGQAHAIDDEGVSEEDYLSINVEGTRRLLDAAKSGGAQKFVFASTVKVFGETTVGCVDETAPPAPRTPYARSKWLAEQLVASASGGVFATVSLRCPLVYGPTQKGNLFRMIAAIDRGQFPPLPRVSTVRSMLHVNNFVSAVKAALESKVFLKPMYVIADLKPYSISEIYDRLRQGLGKQLPLVRVPAWTLSVGARCGDFVQTLTNRSFPFSSSTLEKLIGQAWYSPEAAMRDLGYQPAYTFDSAVPDLIEHYRRSIA